MKSGGTRSTFKESPMYRAVSFDVDGTITDRKLHLDLEAVKLIRKLVSKGVIMILNTGNAAPIAYCLSRYIGCNGPVIAENGGVIVYNGSVRVLADRNRVLDSYTALKRTFPNRVRETLTNRFRLADVSIKTDLPTEIIASFLKGTGVAVYDSGFAVHLMDERWNKGKALKLALEFVGVKKQETVSIGDSMLDIEMFKISGFSIALANAPEDLKSIASMTVDMPGGRGFCKALKSLFRI